MIKNATVNTKYYFMIVYSCNDTVKSYNSSRHIIGYSSDKNCTESNLLKMHKIQTW